MTRRGRLEYAPPDSHAWTVIAHAHVVSILPASTPPELVARLWSAATTASVSLESYVAAFPLFGPDAVESFAVALIEDVTQGAEHPEARIEVVLRGNGIARLQSPTGTRIIDARSSQPWYLGEFENVTSFVLAAAPIDYPDAEADGDATLPLLSGVVPASWARWTPRAPVTTETGELEDTVLGLGTGRREAPVAPPADPAARPVAAPPVIARPQDDGDPLDDDTVLGARARRAQPGPAADDAVDGDTIIPVRGGDPLAAPRMPPSSAELDDTILTPGRRSPERPQQFAPVPGDGGEPPARTPLYAFRVGVGEAYALERPAYLGRKPSAPRIVTGPSPRLVPVGSPRQEVSSTHLEIRQEGTAVVVTDLRSTNGTIVSAPGADRLTLRQGQSVVVAPGTRIDIGDGNVVEILPAR
ncbi:FHA domain-containing protein [Planctomonas deserti]|uniref:FHA domain-containing protein n=1 Tax=Planctomonas deserti TaxID=2144185 RepID=UPI001F0CB114|nr:FHA domain-containing protein [Planctomonas deserti]